MSAAPNVPSDLRQATQAHYIAERDAIIPRFYDASLHEGQYSAVVVYDGVPIAQAGEVLTIGLVPPERRWAIGPVTDGYASCIDQKHFDELCILWKQEEIQFKSQGKEVLDFPLLEARPNVRNFVAWKIHKTDPSRLIPLGMPSERQVVRQGTHVYDPETDSQMTREEWAARQQAKLGAKVDASAAQEARIAELEAKLVALTATVPPSAPPAPEPASVQAKARLAPEMESAPCGKSVQKGRVKPHMRFCKKPECHPEPEQAA
jgi:hypothetical protein